MTDGKETAAADLFEEEPSRDDGRGIGAVTELTFDFVQVMALVAKARVELPSELLWSILTWPDYLLNLTRGVVVSLPCSVTRDTFSQVVLLQCFPLVFLFLIFAVVLALYLFYVAGNACERNSFSFRFLHICTVCKNKCLPGKHEGRPG